MVESEPPFFCSIVIPVFNRADLLRAVLDGLTKQSVSSDRFEVLICDDGSPQSLAEVISEFQVSLPHLRHLRQENQGPAAARNLGIANATSDIVLFLDSDVLPGVNVVSGLAEALVAHPQWQGSEAKLEPIGGEDTLGWDAPRTDTGGHYHTAGIAYRRSVLESVGGMDENFSRAACEDVELAVRVLEHGEIGFISSAVVFHPRRRRTAGTCWNARKNWQFVQILACRYGFLSWPGNRTRFPRLRTAIAASVTLPLGRFRRSILFLHKSPREAIRGIALSVIDWCAGVSMVPTILLGRVPARRSSVSMAKPHVLDSRL